MTWDPEIDDPTTRPPRPRDEEAAPDTTAEPPPAPPDLFAPIDPNAPVSGHRPPPEGTAVVDRPENDWSKAEGLVMPVLRSAGTVGLATDGLAPEALAEETDAGRRQPLVSDGPGGLVVAFALPSTGFEVLVTGEHLLGWGLGGDALRAAAFANLERWSTAAAWTTEEDEHARRIVSSASGDGWDAGRILLGSARDKLRSELAGGRVVVGLPDRDLLVAARITADDPDFEALFATFVVDQADASDEPIDRRLFELSGDTLSPLPV
ncbi:MAG TPA: hypothetical protein VFS32_10040 [Candidatus Limnocylindrales bacterium]|nr:hypothetical protein [Candidatus Limnocylindrales bacterium]